MISIKQWKDYFLFTVVVLLMLLLSITIYQIVPKRHVSTGAESNTISIWTELQTVAVNGENNYIYGGDQEGIGGLGATYFCYDSSSNSIKGLTQDIGYTDFAVEIYLSTETSPTSSAQTESLSVAMLSLLLTSQLPNLTNLSVMGSIVSTTYPYSLVQYVNVLCNRTYNGRKYVFTGISHKVPGRQDFDNADATTIIPTNTELKEEDAVTLYVTDSSSRNVYYNVSDSNLINDAKGTGVGTITLVWIWEYIVYRAVYNISYSDGTKDTFLAGVDKPLKSVPGSAPRGYYTRGWKDSDTGKEIGDNISVSNANKDYKLEPNYIPNSYIFQYNPNGGSMSFEQASGINYNSQYTFPTATKVGYTLTGWKCQSNNITYIPGTSYTVPYFGEDKTTVTFTAQWEANDYTVRFDSAYSNQIRYIRDWLNGGSSANPANHWLEIGAYGSNGINYALKSQGATSKNDSGIITTDYLLDGKYEDLNQWRNPGMEGGGQDYQIIDLGQLRNIEYIVVWHYYGDTRAYKDNTLEVSSDGKTWRAIFSTADTGTYTEKKNGNKVYVNAYRSKTVTYNTDYGKLPSISKIGYTFNGWYLNNTKIGTNTTMTTADDHLLKSSWTVHKYNIAFNPNGGSGKMESKYNVEYDSNVTLPENAFELEGYIFTGWNTRSDGEGTTYSDEAIVKNLTSTQGATITLYAQWEDTWANHATTIGSNETITIDNEKYLIVDSAGDLAYLSKQSINGSLTGNYIQTVDIDLSEHTWLPIGSEHAFCGTYLGQGHKITGLKTSTARNAGGVYLQTYGGLFGKLGANSSGTASAHIIGVHIKDCKNIYGQYSGAIAGYSDISKVKIEACILENIDISGNTTASFVGNSTAGTIQDCLIISSNVSTSNATTKGFYTGTMTVNSSYYMNSQTATKFYTTGASSDYSNWIEGVFQYPLPSMILWYPKK